MSKSIKKINKSVRKGSGYSAGRRASSKKSSVKSTVRGIRSAGRKGEARQEKRAVVKRLARSKHNKIVKGERARGGRMYDRSRGRVPLRIAKNVHNAKRSHKKVKKDIAKTTMNIDYKKSVYPVIESLISNAQAAEYLTKNVSKNAAEVVSLLKKPMSDEEIAEILDMKINAVRRMLNRMHGYGITNYNTSKNKEGWLSFTWYIDTKKVPQFFEYVDNTNQTAAILTDDCNDYFLCEKCYPDNKLILTFDAAYESNFKCVCNHGLSRISKDKVSEIVEEARAPA